MFYREAGFRALYKHFAAFMLNDVLRKSIEDFPDARKANCVLTYGYIDHEKGLMLEILAAGFKDGNDFKFYGTSPAARAAVPIAEVIEEEIFRFDGSEADFGKSYAAKIAMLKDYAASDEIERTRRMEFFDKSRNEMYPDDVTVVLSKQGLSPEECLVRIIGVGDNFFMGQLMDEPKQDFGHHKGERIAFIAEKQDDGSIVLCSDLTPDRTFKAEELEDGSLLKEAAARFNKAQTKENFIELLQLLRDSNVWVPCNTAVSEADMAELEKAVEESGDISTMIGKTIKTKDEVRLIPEILQNGEHFFFPIFTSAEEMGECSDHFTKVRKHILDVIPMARRNKQELAGIVLNAFSEPFVLTADLFDTVEKMKSRIV